MNRCYLGLGSNQRNPVRQIRRAIQSLKALPNTYVTKVSGLYWNKAWGMQAQQDFCNVVVEVFTQLTPLLLLKKCRIIELRQEKNKRKHWGPRTIDIDIILYGNRVINTPDLKTPHPHMTKRNFVMIPLREISQTIE